MGGSGGGRATETLRYADLVSFTCLKTFALEHRGEPNGLQLIGKALGHTQMRTTERYAHLRDDPLHALVNEIGERVKAGGKAGLAK